MTAGIEGNPGRAMAGSMTALSVTVACLTDQEWEKTAPMLGMSPDERAGMQCLMEALGGPGQMVAAMTAAQEGEFAELASAGAECRLEMGPPAVQPPGTAPPASKATMEAPTPAPTTTTPGPTPTRMPTTAPSTSAPTPTTTLVITVAAIPAELPEYDRSDWRHWVDVQAGYGTPGRATAWYCSTGVQGDHGSAHAGPDNDDTRAHTDQDANDGPVNVGTNTDDHPGDHRRRDSRGAAGVRPV